MESYTMKAASAQYPTHPSILPVILLVGCISLLQWHSIQFWQTQVDATTGWAWSLLLEAVALWLWYCRRLLTRILGAIASLLLLAGPVYHVGQPVLQQWLRAEHADQARLRTTQLLQASILELQQRLKETLAQARKRPGWQTLMARTQAELASARAQLAQRYAEPPQAMPVQQASRTLIVVMQWLALVLYQTVGVLAVLQLSQRRQRSLVPGMPVPPAPGQSPNTLPLQWQVGAWSRPKEERVH